MSTDFGFSGNGLLELSVGKYLVQVEHASAVILDCLHNMNASLVRANTVPLVKFLRQSWPHTPIIFAEGVPYGLSWQPSSGSRQSQLARREQFREAYANLTKAGVRGLHYVTGDQLFANVPAGIPFQPTEAGTHPTDLGMASMAKFWIDYLPNIIALNATSQHARSSSPPTAARRVVTSGPPFRAPPPPPTKSPSPPPPPPPLHTSRTATQSRMSGEEHPAQWANSSNGIHAFLTFDSHAAPTSISTYGKQIDFVWGATASHVPLWRAANPRAILSKYIPFTRDPAPSPSSKDHLEWWRAHHPDLVLYRCDRQTPAWECFAGEGCRHTNVPLDLTRAGTLAYQMSAAVLPAKRAGYTAIALDNFGLRNTWKACGSFSGPNGSWAQLYDIDDPSSDPQYALDVVDWTRRASSAIHAAGLLVLPNWSDMRLEDANVRAVLNATDGVLAEAGFTEWNPVPNTSSFRSPPPLTNPSRFEAQVRYVRSLQRHGKAYFAINEWGAGPDYGLNPSRVPYNVTGDANRPLRQFIVASFMMVNGGACGIFLSCIQCYGGQGGGLGNLSIWPEYAAPVGHPLNEPVKNETTGVWSRMYSSGLALVNPTAVSHHVWLPTSGAQWRDIYGGGVLKSPTVLLAPASALVLLGAK